MYIGGMLDEVRPLRLKEAVILNYCLVKPFSVQKFA
jgi:hypothetical protein